MKRRGLTVAIAFALCLALGGCSSTGRFSSSGSEIVQLNLLTAPVGLDLDGRPGIDGFSAKVYASNASDPKAVPIRNGMLEVLMFDGTLFGRTNVPPALHTWSFTAEQLRNYEFKARIGTGYELLLAWGPDIPTRNLITVGARYTSPEGKIITSGLSSVTVLNK